jgi:hypothetical protein
VQTARTTTERVELMTELSRYAEQEPWHAVNLARVEVALQETTSNPNVDH